MMEKKKLVINAAICDARTVSESTLEVYESIVINAATIIVSKESNELMARYNITMDTAQVMEAPSDAEILVQNGTYEISENTVMSNPTILVVNGSLEIKKGSKQALDKFISIIVNGQVSYPSDIQEQLPKIQVNGATDCYPGDAIRLKSKFILDKVFIMKAKESKYYVKNKVVIADETLNISQLVDKGATFITKKAMIAENLLEQALPLFDDEVDIQVIPAGFNYLTGDRLTDSLIKKNGTKLYVDGDLIVDLDSSIALEQLQSVKVNGTVLIVKKLIDKFQTLDAEYEKLKLIKGTILGDRGVLTVDKSMITRQEEGITISDCGVVQLQEDITPNEIEEKLQFIDCGCIFCYPPQRSAVELVSENVGNINDSGSNVFGGSNETMEDDKLFGTGTKVINAACYKM